MRWSIYSALTRVSLRVNMFEVKKKNFHFFLGLNDTTQILLHFSIVVDEQTSVFH